MNILAVYSIVDSGSRPIVYFLPFGNATQTNCRPRVHNQ
jgi:hypothetical protein